MPCLVHLCEVKRRLQVLALLSYHLLWLTCCWASPPLQVKRRLEVLALLTHGNLRDAANLVAQYPTLLGSGESQLADNAR